MPDIDWKSCIVMVAHSHEITMVIRCVVIVAHLQRKRKEESKKRSQDD